MCHPMIRKSDVCCSFGRFKHWTLQNDRMFASNQFTQWTSANLLVSSNIYGFFSVLLRSEVHGWMHTQYTIVLWMSYFLFIIRLYHSRINSSIHGVAQFSRQNGRFHKPFCMSIFIYYGWQIIIVCRVS